MEAEDDMIVLVVVDDEERSKLSHSGLKQEPESSSEDTMEVNDIIETAEKHGEYIAVKIEPDDFESDYLEDEMLQRVIKSESNYDAHYQDNDNSQDYGPREENGEHIVSGVADTHQQSKKHRFSMLKPWQQKSFVAELRQQYAELREDEELLINTLEQIMRSVKAPPPPRDYYVMNGIMFECAQCGAQSDTVSSITRHFQEKHGQRYLVCYACGVDFRSTTNLYKHEKRCVAPDAHVVLKARAACVGRKGRSRPYLALRPVGDKAGRARFPCQLCSAVFMTRSTLQSHENLHRGERPFRCHACPCAYTSYSALSRHTKKHTDVQFICDHCSRSFKIKAALVSHLDTHKPIRKHGCGECVRRFAQKSALLLHVNRVHRRLPPPCACHICPKRYPRMSLLKAHMKRAHGMSIITRKMFFKSLPTMTELEVKESKVILKSEDDILEYSVPYEAEEMFQKSIEQNMTDEKANGNIENADSIEIAEPTGSNMTMNNFIQYVTKTTKDIGTNVIYIQNGEVVQGTIGDGGQENLILQVEAMVDGGQVLLDSFNGGDSIGQFNIVKSEDLAK